jgi:phosphoglycerate dehydrogenase-like enzyme
MLRIVIPDDAPAVLGPSRAYAEWRAQTAGRYAVDYYDTLPGSEPALIERIGDADIVINIRSSSKFTAPVLEACPKLRLLSLWGTGTDNVDLAAAARCGVTVTNTPSVSAPAIAEHCLALMLAVARRIPHLDAEIRQGRWPRGFVSLMCGKTLGVIGLGAIGRRFAALGEAIGMRVIAWTFHPKPELPYEMVPLERLYRESDVVSVHLRLSPATRKMIGRNEFALMKPGAIFLNTARGPIVDEEALVEALASGRLAGAGLDVFEVEPLPPGHPLTRLENVVLTPHSAGVTPETLEAGLRMALENVENFLAGAPANVVRAADPEAGGRAAGLS